MGDDQRKMKRVEKKTETLYLTNYGTYDIFISAYFTHAQSHTLYFEGKVTRCDNQDDDNDCKRRSKKDDE